MCYTCGVRGKDESYLLQMLSILKMISSTLELNSEICRISEIWWPSHQFFCIVLLAVLLLRNQQKTRLTMPKNYHGPTENIFKVSYRM